MKLTLKNIGKISSASVELNGITVIAGENNTGKSTIGKSLYCIFNSFYGLKEQIENTRMTMLSSAIRNAFDDYYEDYVLNSDKLATEIVKEINQNVITLQIIRDLIEDNTLRLVYNDIENEEDIESEVGDFELTEECLNTIEQKVQEILLVSEKSIFMRIFQKKLETEFKGQVTNVFTTTTQGEIGLRIKDKNIVVTLDNNKVQALNGLLDLKTQVIYLDDPFVLDELSDVVMRRSYLRRRSKSFDSGLTHREHLKKCIHSSKDRSDVEEAIQELIVDNKMQRILDKINTVCDGEMKLNTLSSYSYSQISKSSQSLFVENLSTGIKAFLILKTLLLKGFLEENGTIILDEPEVHLHPEWQLIFAELIVLLQSEFKMHVLLTTHSPYFLNAIEVYSEKHGVAEKCKYYLAKNENNIASIDDVTDNLEAIYSKLYRPLQKLEREAYQDD